MDAGVTHYLRAVVRDWYRRGATVSPFGAYSNVVEYTPEISDPSVTDVKVGKSSVTFRFGSYEVTGYEIYRKSGTGTKYTKVATVADNMYTDKSLKSNTSYSYKIRAYVYDKDTQRTNYSDYIYRTYTTWGNALNLKAGALSARSVKLNWKKVDGASGYKIYRATGGTSTSESKDGYTASYSSYKLIRTIKKAQTTSYTDKKLNAGETYSYKVVAFKNVKNGKKTDVLNIEGYASVALGFEGFDGVTTKEIAKADGSVTLKWGKIVGAEKYIVKQYGKKADGDWDYIAIAELSAATTSYTFPAGESNETWRPEYKICVCSGKEIDTYYVETSVNKVPKTTGITAVPKADLTGVTVSWQAVPGAAYYKVYRSTRMSSYNPNKDCYGYSGNAVQILKKAGTPVTDALGTYYDKWSDNEPEYTDEITALSVVDEYLGYPVKKSGVYNPKTKQDDPGTIVMEDVQQAPAQGIRYYYYVRAFAPNGKLLDDGTPAGYNGATQFDKPASVVLNSVALKKPAIKGVKAGKKKATVSWKKVTGATKYYVYYSTKKNAGYIFGGTTTKTSLTVSGLNSGRKYYFKVKACAPNAVGADVYSALSAAKAKKVK